MVALANVDADPDKISYVVPGNDKAKKSIEWFLERIGKAYEEGVKLRAVAPAQAKPRQRRPLWKRIINAGKVCNIIENYGNQNNVTAEAVQKLREMTSAGVMDCRKALIEANGDIDAAVKIIREKGLAKVEKRADRETGAGLVQSYVHNERIGVLLRLSAETDFVVRSEPFRTLAHDLAMHIAAAAPKDVEELLAQPYIKDESRDGKDVIGEVIAKVGENVTVGEFYRIEV